LPAFPPPHPAQPKNPTPSKAPAVDFLPHGPPCASSDNHRRPPTSSFPRPQPRTRRQNAPLSSTVRTNRLGTPLYHRCTIQGIPSQYSEPPRQRALPKPSISKPSFLPADFDGLGQLPNRQKHTHPSSIKRSHKPNSRTISKTSTSVAGTVLSSSPRAKHNKGLYIGPASSPHLGPRPGSTRSGARAPKYFKPKPTPPTVRNPTANLPLSPSSANRYTGATHTFSIFGSNPRGGRPATSPTDAQPRTSAARQGLRPARPVDGKGVHLECPSTRWGAPAIFFPANEVGKRMTGVAFTYPVRSHAARRISPTTRLSRRPSPPSHPNPWLGTPKPRL